MTRFVAFAAYVGTGLVHLDASRVTHLAADSYKGTPGTVIHLDTGAQVHVQGNTVDAVAAIEKALDIQK